MLRACADGFERDLKTHHWWVTYKGVTFCALPIGERGANRPEVFIGKVRSMARHLGIMDCAKKQIRGL